MYNDIIVIIKPHSFSLAKPSTSRKRSKGPGPGHALVSLSGLVCCSFIKIKKPMERTERPRYQILIGITIVIRSAPKTRQFSAIQTPSGMVGKK